MNETQNIEFKQSWHDEYLKWICGFANAQGGLIFIGKNDNGEAVGLPNSTKLMEDIPNKVRDVLGIMVDVDLLTENEFEYLKITVEAYPYPVNYKGQYHYRSGSTKQELKGAALNKFILEKTGKHWDGTPITNLLVDELDNRAFEYFRKQAAKSKRVDLEVLAESNSNLLENLHLFDNKFLKQATSLLFYANPEKFVTGAYIKIGYFASDSDLLYQDEVHGNLFEQNEKTIDFLLTKYTKAAIRYEGISRIEEYPFPELALREALLNAVAHKDYQSGNPIQISVYENKIIIWNAANIGFGFSLEKLLQKHPSEPHNPDIANAFFRAGLIEAWGRGISKIVKECLNSN